MREISLIGISHIVFGIILISAKKKERSDYILMTWLAVLMMPFIQQFILEQGNPVSGLSRLSNPTFTLINGPFLYLYIREVTKHEISGVRYWLHFIPFSLFYLLMVISPPPLQTGGPSGPSQNSLLLYNYFGIINVLIFTLYALFSLWYLARYRNRLKETFAWRSGEITLIWLSLIPLFFFILLLIIFLFENTSLRSLIEIEKLHQTGFLLFALYLIFFGLRQKRVFPVKGADKTSYIPETETKRKEAGLPKEDDAELIEKLKTAMSKEKLYRNPKLSVYDLTQVTGISKHRISALLNENLKRNFFQFVNEYRLNEVCLRLKEDTEARYNILELAYDSGFNSKSSFNSLFKTAYGVTPSQYKKSLKSQNA